MHTASIRHIEELDWLPTIDNVAVNGRLINAPLAVARNEIGRLNMHLRHGGDRRHLGYRKLRWEQDARLPPCEWGERTDCPGTPWKYFDRGKILWFIEPSEVECHSRAYSGFDIKPLPG
jgi:hypothetical protein